MAKLSEKQKRFVQEYLVDLNATAAAKRAGYSPKTASEQGARLLANVKVQEEIQKAIEKRQNRVEITQDRVLQELASIAFAKGTDYASIISGVVMMNDTEELTEEQKAAIDADTSLSDIQRVIENAELTNDLLTLASDRQFAGRCNYFTLNGYDKPLNFDSIAVDMSPANYAAVIAAIDPDDETILMSGHSSVASSLGNVDWNAAGAEGSLLGTLSTYRQAARLAYEGRPDSTLTDRLKAYDNPFFARAIDNIDAVAQKRFAEAARLVSPVPDVEDTEIINAIAAMHPGKVVLIDRWNTWCGPCKAGIAETEPLKADLLSDPDIVWVYIADESSPVPAYYKMIPSIKGHHYRLTESQSRAIYDRYGIDGIPYYFLIDRKGTVTPRPDFRDHDLLVSTILEELKK